MRCRECGAGLARGAPWCSLCYATTRTEPAGPGPTGRPEARSLAAGTGWPCGACGTATGWNRGCCRECGTPFLGGLTADRPALVLPWIGDLTALSRAARLGWAGGCALVAAALLVGLLALAGTLL